MEKKFRTSSVLFSVFFLIWAIEPIIAVNDTMEIAVEILEGVLIVANLILAFRLFASDKMACVNYLKSTGTFSYINTAIAALGVGICYLYDSPMIDLWIMFFIGEVLTFIIPTKKQEEAHI